MKKHKHTPGPWKTDYETENESVLGPDGILVADCCILGNHRSPEINQANAILISLAPDLLDLCQWALGADRALPKGIQSFKLEQALESVIAKAEGTK